MWNRQYRLWEEWNYCYYLEKLYHASSTVLIRIKISYFCHVNYTQEQSNKSMLLCVPESCWFALPYCLHIPFTSCWKVLESLVSQHTRCSMSLCRMNPVVRTNHIQIYTMFVFLLGIRAYEQLGNRAFGPPGKMLAACIITIHNIGGVVMSFPPFNVCVWSCKGMRIW